MNPEEREALLASYALGTLSAPDVADAERLIRSDSTAAEEVERFQEIAEGATEFDSEQVHRPVREIEHDDGNAAVVVNRQGGMLRHLILAPGLSRIPVRPGRRRRPARGRRSAGPSRWPAS